MAGAVRHSEDLPGMPHDLPTNTCSSLKARLFDAFPDWPRQKESLICAPRGLYAYLCCTDLIIVP